MKDRLACNQYIRISGGGWGGGAIGGAVRLHDPASFLSKVAEDFIDVGARGEAVAAVLAEAVKNVGGDGPPLPLSHLRPLFLNRTSYIGINPTASLAHGFLHY